MFPLTPVSERQVGYVVQALAAARRQRVRRIVRVSAIGGGDARAPMLLSRLHEAAEREMRAAGCAWTVGRPAT